MNQGGTSTGKEQGKGTKVVSHVYTGQHICSTEPLLIKPYFSLQKSCAALPGQAGMEQEGRLEWQWVRGAHWAGCQHPWETAAGREGQEGAAVSVMSVSAVWVGVGAVQARLSALVELLATRSHQEHTLSLGTSRTWECATAAACTENTPLDPATSSSWQAGF